MNSIERIINKLSWNEDISTQKKTIEELTRIVDDNDIKFLIQPGKDKSCWENSALVLKAVGAPRINREIPSLLEWLQDLNWPGAMTVLGILATVDEDIILPYVDKARERAIRDDEMWLEALDQLRELIKSKTAN